MPDWFYRTLSRPLLFQISPAASRTIATGFMGSLSQLPGNFGRHIIEFLGHMQPPPTLQTPLLGTQVSSPIGLGCHLDPKSTALLAWQNFGFGFLEIGPVGTHTPVSSKLLRHAASQSIENSLPLACTPPQLTLQHLSRLKNRLTLPLTLRWMINPSDTPVSAAHSLSSFLSQLSPFTQVHGITLDRITSSAQSSWSLQDWQQFWEQLPHPNNSPHRLPRLLWLLTPDSALSLLPLAERCASQDKIAGIHLESRVATSDSILHGSIDLDSLTQIVSETRKSLPHPCDLLISGGIHDPASAVALLNAGASAILIDTGLIYSGPGLPKRINQCIHALRSTPNSISPSLEPSPPPSSVFNHAWFWTLMLGLGMFIGGLMALGMATGRVVMPYDEVYCGLTARQLSDMNPKLLPFMSHDRVTLAGAMLSISILYTSLSWFGVRPGIPGCRTSILISAGVGFASFFLFLGFDYFDPFHAFVTAILFQLFIQALIGKHQISHQSLNPDWVETAAWRKAQWGQFLWIIHACGLLIAGVVIAWIGSTEVLVATDQEFLGSSPRIFRSQNSRILPLIAHDRATLGGMLIAAGIPFLLTTLWVVRKGERWLWHSLLSAAFIAYIPAIGIHFAIGYIHWFHLLPAFAGLTLFIAGAALLHPWMTSAPSSPTAKTTALPLHSP